MIRVEELDSFSNYIEKWFKEPVNFVRHLEVSSKIITKDLILQIARKLDLHCYKVLENKHNYKDVRYWLCLPSGLRNTEGYLKVMDEVELLL